MGEWMYYVLLWLNVLCRAMAVFSVSWTYTESVGLLGRGISPSHGFYLHTEKHSHRIKAHNTNIHMDLEWDSNPRSHRSSERRCLCHRPLGHCDWRTECINPHNLGTSWRWVVIFMLQSLYPRVKSPGTYWIISCVSPRVGLDDMEKRKFLTLPGLELRPPVPTQSLYQLNYSGVILTRI
jgi:hypothetical protein